MRRLRMAYFYTPVRLHRIPNKQYVFDTDVQRERIRKIFERTWRPIKWNFDGESHRKEAAKQAAEWLE